MKNDEVLLSIKNLKQYFNAGKKNEVRAIEIFRLKYTKGKH
ncbi:Oligopeptide transport ATP-binding protein oppF [Staphylococcus aureus]|nr:Oligopeptide transport ATP-binding protein oppF [Staphylococcus aureus]